MTSRAPALVLVADDLTGACDAAGVVATRGEAARVDLRWSGAPPRGVLAVDLDSRAGDDERAAARTARVTHDALAAGAVVYVKIDSTLRGHVRTTVEAATRAFLATHPSGRVVVCPAFPARGRTVVGGRLHVEGAPRDSSVLAELGEISGVEIADASTDDDLAALVAERAGRPVLWVGSAGMAAHVAGAAVDEVARAMPQVRSVAVVVGTEHAATIAAGRDLRRRGDPRIEVVDGDPRVRAMIDRAETAGARHAGLVVTGGFTARRLLDRLGITALRVGGEVEAGIPWSTTLDGSRVLVTKAGGFGDRGTLGRAVDRLLGAP